MSASSRMRAVVCLAAILAAARCASNRGVPIAAGPGPAESYLDSAREFAANAQFDGANFYLSKAVAVLRSAQDWERVIQCLVQIGNNWQRIGDLARARESFDLALQTLKSRSGLESIELAKSLQQLAFKLLAQREFTQALELLNRALAIQQKLYGNEHPELSKIYNSLALVYLHMGDHRKASELSVKSLSAKLRKFLDTDSSFLGNYGFLDGLSISERSFQDMSGMLDRSLGVYLESLGGRSLLVASIYEKIGMVYSLQGEHDRGLEFFRQALRICQEEPGADPVQLAQICGDIGICLRLKGDLDDSRGFLQRALDMAQGRGSPLVLSSIHFQLGKSCHIQNRLQEALSHYQQALAEMAPGYAPGNPGANPRAEAVAEKQYLLEVLAAKAAVLEAAASLKPGGKSERLAALEAARQAVRVIDLLRADYKAENYRLIFGEKTQQILDLAVRVAVSLHRLTGVSGYREEAFHFAEKSKAALLSEHILELNARQFSGIPGGQLARERELKNELTQCETLLEKRKAEPAPSEPPPASDPQDRYYRALAQYQELISSFERDYPRYFELKYGSRQTSIARLQAELPPRTCLIEYFLGADSVQIFFLSRDEFEVVSQALENPLAATIDDYCRSIRKIDEKEFLRLSPKLFQILIAPLEKHLKNKETLLIIPDRALSLLPFETLIGREGAGGDFSQLDYLLRRFEISYHYSAALWLQRRARAQNGRPPSLAGFAPVFAPPFPAAAASPAGAPADAARMRTVTMNGLEFPELPGTEDELRAILDLCGRNGIRARGFFRAEATEEAFKSPAMKDFSMIHLATHSLKNESSPKLSGFLFYPPHPGWGGEDGVLYADETYNVQLDCELLVLSSCESGSGPLVEGEGILALTRGLFYSGASGIIFSLWKVEDEASSRLMIRLYRDILLKNSYARSLQQAKLSFVADRFTAFPKYWAGFILLGT